ncbi:MAG: hypothetical protein ACI9ON_003730 [Limisphaerales bacterium]|jgi:hypothetical protein
MVAAYLIGGIVMPATHNSLDSMANISACAGPEALHCVVHWDTMAEGASTELFGLARPADSLCTNPLSWQVNEELVTAEKNAGAVIPEGTYNAEAVGCMSRINEGQSLMRQARWMRAVTITCSTIHCFI